MEDEDRSVIRERDLHRLHTMEMYVRQQNVFVITFFLTLAKRQVSLVVTVATATMNMNR